MRPMSRSEAARSKDEVGRFPVVRKANNRVARVIQFPGVEIL